MPHPYTINFVINNPKLNVPNRLVEVPVDREKVRFLVDNGYLVLEDLFTQEQLQAMTAALDAVAEREAEYRDPNNPDVAANAQYVRWLMDKDPAFEHLFQCRATAAIARAVLGPQIHFENVDGRICPEGVAGQVVPWHIHLRVVPEPLPPFFCYPHAVHCCLYLSEVNKETGSLCVLPGSHRNHSLKFNGSDSRDIDGQVELEISAGTCVLMHVNTWHKTKPSTSLAGRRRLLIFSYCPSWMRSDQRGGVLPERSFAAERLTNEADPETRELLGEFYWC